MKKILVVEDDVLTAELLKTYLLPKGYEVVHVSNGLKTLETAKTQRPDLILLDVMLPGLDGHTVQMKLLEEKETSEIPIILMTAKTQLEQVFVNAKNVVGLIAKPFNIKELNEKIKSALSQ